MPETKEFEFPSSTGQNSIYAKMYIPDSTPRGIVQIAHGIAEHIGRYDGFMKFLAENGFVAVGNDHLGHGKTASLQGGERGFFAEENGWEHAVDDMDRLHDRMCSEYPDLPYIFFGHSMGSFLTRTYMIKYPDKPDCVILSGTGHQTKAAVTSGLTLAQSAVKLKGAHAAGEKINTIAFGSYNKKYDDVRTDFDWLTSDSAIVDKYIEDPDCGFVPSVSMFRDMMGGIKFITDPENIAKMNKELPVLFISGWDDPVGEYGKGVKRAFKAFVDAGMKHVHIKLYPNGRHELLNETNKDEIMDYILETLNKHFPE